MNLEELKKRLSEYNEKEIIFTEHAKVQAIVREIDLEEVKENILNPTKLVYAEKQETENKSQEKYDCYFAYSKHLYHRYALVINHKVIIVTIIKINRDWQRAIEGK